MMVEIGNFSTNVPAGKIVSVPAGVLSGSFEFPVGYTVVRLTATNEAGITADCSFTVKVLGKIDLFLQHLLGKPHI